MAERFTFCAPLPCGKRVLSRSHRATSATCSLLSSPFPLPDVFAIPSVVFPRTIITADWRPELLGSILWTTGLYLGISEKERWGATSLRFARDVLIKLSLSAQLAELIAAVIHSVPFLVAGFGIDACLRYSNGGNAVWAVASGLSIAMYGGVYELGRMSASAKLVSTDDEQMYQLFCEFAARQLRKKGRCHLVDVRSAVRQDSKARRVASVSDETMRRFIRNYAPDARRSPNGFYRGLSIRAPQDNKRPGPQRETR